MTAYIPQTVSEAVELIAERIPPKRPIQVIGTGSRIKTGTVDTVSVQSLNRVIFFHPEDMVIGVSAGMNVCDLKAVIAEKNMALHIEEFSPHTTVGSAVAMSDSGASRLFGGGIRDQIIGIEYINGHGELVKGGGKVVKNVAGYDIPKMLIGSQGGLGLITQVNFKVFPAKALSKTAIQQTTDTSFLKVLAELNQKFIPIDHLRVIYDGKTYTLAAGYSGAQIRIDRLEKELTKIIPNVTFIDDSATNDIRRYLPDTSTYSAFGMTSQTKGDYLHLQVFSEPSFLCSEKIWQKLNDAGCQILCHPFSGDIHLISSKAADRKMPQETIRKLLEIFPEKIKAFLIHSPTTVFPYSEFSKLPGHLTLAKLLKKSLDPANIFYAPFYTDL